MAVEIRRDRKIESAGHGRRMTHLFLDSALSLAFGVVVWFFIAYVAVSAGFSSDPILTQGFVLFLVTFGLYFLVFESVFNRTPAKFLTGTVVVTDDFQKPTFLQILGRTLSRFVPVDALTFMGSEASGWHDRWSGTRVVIKSSLDSEAALAPENGHVSAIDRQTKAIATQGLQENVLERDFVVILADGCQSNWLDRQTLEDWFEAGRVKGSTYVYAREIGDWQLLRDLAGFSCRITQQVADVFGEPSSTVREPANIYQTAKIETGADSTAEGPGDDLPLSDLVKNTG